MIDLDAIRSRSVRRVGAVAVEDRDALLELVDRLSVSLMDALVCGDDHRVNETAVALLKHRVGFVDADKRVAARARVAEADR